ncbi:LacI family DNA-binding transcriptional regulator [Pseudoalteromonas sp. SSDWG2]|uniref:LacI family DNA-binding transcriptional regulator n=1 Tax=Pseudoalteromonas sp. SSDWG2 TaxID=3139391 RepID=UPI003BA85C6B
MANTASRPRITIIDVARQAGVSKSTVSLVINNADNVSANTKEKVRQAMAELGYVYNRGAASLRAKHSTQVAIVLPSFTSAVMSDLAQQLQQGVFAMGYVPMLLCSDDNTITQKQLIERLQEANVSAIILCPATNTDVNWQNSLHHLGIKVINVLREVPFSEAPCVLADCKRAAFIATKALVDAKCNPTLMIGGTAHRSDYEQYCQGYEQALAQYGALSSSLMLPCPLDRRAIMDMIPQLIALNNREQALGLVCYSHLVAQVLSDELAHHGLLAGKDFKLIGFGDLPDLASRHIPLSAISFNTQDIARHTLDNLNALLQGNNVARRTLIDVTHIKRASCS